MSLKGFGVIVLLVCSSVAFANQTIPGEGLVAEGKHEWQKAISIYMNHLLKNPDSVELWLRVATIEYQQKNYTLAISAYKHAFLLQPNNPIIAKNLSEIFAQLNNPSEALRYINEAVKLKPDDANYLLAKAQIANWNNVPGMALDSYQRLLELSKNGNTTINQLELLTAIGSLQSQLRQYQAATQTYLQALQLSPANAALYSQLSQTYSLWNQPENALQAISKALELDPNNVKFLQSKAVIASWLQQDKVALETYQRLLALGKEGTPNFNRVELLMQIGRLQNQLHDYSESVQTYSEAITLDPDNATLYQTLSQIHAANNEPVKALAAIDMALKIEPNNSDFLKSKAQFAYWLKDNSLALQTYQKLLSISKETGQSTDSLDLFMQIGSLYNQSKQYAKATKLYEQALLTYPNNAGLYYALAQTYAAAKTPHDALLAINKALKLKPDNSEYIKFKDSLNVHSKIEPIETLFKGIMPSEMLVKPMQTVTEVKKPAPFNEFINLANNEASLRHYGLAANALKKAIQLRPEAKLYKQLSQIYAMANQPLQALDAIKKALEITPDNIDYWRAKAKLAAWAGNKFATQQSYETILKLKPGDQDAMLNLAHVLAWRGQTDLSLCAYRAFLLAYPRVAEGWIQYAEVLSWIENYPGSFNALAHYKQLDGDEFKYLKTKARVLASAGRFQSALRINEPLLQETPKDSYLLITEVNALNKALETRKALSYLEKLNEINTTDDPQVKGLNQIFLTPLRSNINVGTNYTSSSDTTRIRHIPTLEGQYFLSTTTSLLLLGLHENASAALGSGLETIDGTNSISDDSLMVGFGSQIPSILNFKGVAGVLKIEGKNEHGIYDAGIRTNLGETIDFGFQSLRNLYRPYLIPQSPRLISLQIMEKRNGIAFQWQPLIQKYFNAVISHSDLSDNNGYWHVNLWPKARVYSSQDWQVNLGVNADIWKYKRRANDGYFSPLLFKGYEGTFDFYYGISENVGLSASGGFGMQKDETFPRYYYEEDLSAQLFVGIFTDWQLKWNAGYTLRTNPQNNSYRSWNTGLILTRRF